MGNWRWPAATGAGLAAMVLVLGACGGGADGSAAAPSDDPESGPSTTASSEPGSCADDRHGVVFDIDGTLTVRDDDLLRSVADPAYDPPVRPGAVEMITAYRERGYEIVYLSGRPATLQLGGAPAAEATEGWLDRHGFPIGEGTHLYLWDEAIHPELVLYKTQVLLDLASDRLAIDYGYTNDELDIEAYTIGGVPVDRIYTKDPVAGQAGTVAVPGSGWVDHIRQSVTTLQRVCSS